MTIRIKALIIIGVSLLCMAGLVYATSRLTLMRGLEEIEERYTNNSVEQVVSAFSYIISDLEADIHRWSGWDDTYAFIEDGNGEYIQSNLVDETFINSKLNLMLFVHSSGQIVFGKAFDLANEEEMTIPQDLLGYLSGSSPLISRAGTHNFISGIILLSEGPVLIASQPILTSEDKGPARGTLIFARYLNSETINELTQLVLFPITMRPVNNLAYPDFKDALSSLSQEEPIFVKPLNTQYISGYTLLKDVYGKPALMLRADVPREAFQLGQLTTSYYILSVLGLGVLVAAIAMFMVQKQIISRFNRLIRGIDHIATSGDTATRISVGGGDELSLVAGTINGMLATLQEAQGELRAREEKYRILADNVTDIIFTMDMNLRFTYVSPSVTTFSGYSVEEVTGLPLKEVLTADSFQVTMKAFAEEMAIENLEHEDLSRSRMLELEMRCKDGSTTWAEVSITFIRDSGDQAIGVMGLARDITERRQAREQLRKLYEHEDLRQELEVEIDKRIEFSRALVHELKTPITPVIASSDLLVEELKDEALLGLARNIKDGAYNLNKRIDELLDLARSEIGALKLNLEPVDAMKLLNDAALSMIPLALSYRHDINLELPSSLPTVWADAERIQQIVLNLVNNAFKFTAAGGTITLRAMEDDVNLLVEVEDTGRGITKEEQERLFEPYYKTETDRGRLSGLGLGLGLSKTLVELHGGRIWVKSRKGKGSTFGFSIPLKAANQGEKDVETR